MNAKNTADAPAARFLESAEETVNGVSPDLIEERIKAKLELLIEQISTLTQLLNQLIQENSAHNSPTAGPRTQMIQAIVCPVMMQELLQSRQQVQSSVLDFRSTITF